MVPSASPSASFRDLLGRVLVGELHRFGDRAQPRRLPHLQRRHAGADVVVVEVLVAGDGHRGKHALRDLDADHAAGQLLLGQRDGDRAVTGLAIGVLQGLHRRLDVLIGAARASQRGDAPVDLGRGQQCVALDLEAADDHAHLRAGSKGGRRRGQGRSGREGQENRCSSQACAHSSCFCSAYGLNKRCENDWPPLFSCRRIVRDSSVDVTDVIARTGPEGRKSGLSSRIREWVAPASSRIDGKPKRSIRGSQVRLCRRRPGCGGRG